MELKDGSGTGYGKSKSRCRDTTHKQRKKTRHGKVYHQDLQHKDKACYGSLEDACHSTRCTTSHKQHHLPGRQAEHPAQSAADGTASEHDGSLCTHRSSKSDGDGTGHHRSPCVMRTYEALLASYGKQNLGHTMTDVIANNIAHEEHGKPYTYHRIHQIKPVGSVSHKLMGKESFYLTNKPLQEKSCTGCKDTHKQTDEEKKLVVTHMTPAPSEGPCHGIANLDIPVYLIHPVPYF